MTKGLQFAVAAVAVFFLLSACATTLTSIDRSCGTGDNLGRCSGVLTVPVRDSASFRRAARIAIDRVFSEAFANEVNSFMTENSENLRQHSDWVGLTPEAVVTGLRNSVHKAALGTYDGPIAWFEYHAPWWRNLAYEGTQNGPATVNRWGIGHRSDSSLANTIVHEAAHAASLTHNDRNAVCAPPYVVGEILQWLENDAADQFISHCKWFDLDRPRLRAG